MSRKWKRIAIILAGMMGLATLSFNCAPHLLEGAKIGSASSSSLSIFDKNSAPSPYALMTADQIFQSMLNVTDQTGHATTAEENEYQMRKVALGTSNQLSSMNGPFMIALTSLAGEVCNGLIMNESAMASADRKFFAQVDFSQPLAGNTLSAYNTAVANMANAFWGHSPTTDELDTLDGYYNDFVSQLSSSQASKASETKTLYLSLCAGMLSSFDTVTL